MPFDIVELLFVSSDVNATRDGDVMPANFTKIFLYKNDQINST